MATLDVNTDASIVLTNKLERLNRSAFPSAVRNTLNQVAFDMKREHLPKSFKKNFKPKSGTMPYYKKSIGIDKANGFSIKDMKAVVSLLDPSNKVDKRFVEGLYKQEKGGVIDDGLRYLKGARGNRVRGRVLTENYYDKNNVISGRSKRKGTRKSKFVARVYRSIKEDKPMFLNSMKGNFLVKVKSFSSNYKTKKLDIKFTFIAMERKVKKTTLKRTYFTKEAGIEASKTMDKIYSDKANYQFKKHLK